MNQGKSLDNLRNRKRSFVLLGWKKCPNNTHLVHMKFEDGTEGYVRIESPKKPLVSKKL